MTIFYFTTKGNTSNYSINKNCYLIAMSVYLYHNVIIDIYFWSIKMGTNNNYSQQFDEAPQEAEEWLDKGDFEEESIEQPKGKQQQHSQEKAQVRRNIEDFKEEQRLKKLLGDDFYD